MQFSSFSHLSDAQRDSFFVQSPSDMFWESYEVTQKAWLPGDEDKKCYMLSTSIKKILAFILTFFSQRVFFYCVKKICLFKYYIPEMKKIPPKITQLTQDLGPRTQDLEMYLFPLS